jgi:HemY protein
MKRILLALILLLVFSAWVLYSSPEDGGYLLIAFGSKTIEMSLWLAGLIIFVTVFLLWLCWWILSGSVSVARNLGDLLSFGGSERAQKRTASGMIDYIEGNWQQAHKKLLRAAPKVEAPLLNYLAAARSAYQMGNYAEAKRILTVATNTTPDNELAVALTQAQMELDSKQYDQCLATLMQVKSQAPQNPVLLDLLRQVYLARQDWDGLQGIIDRLRNYKIISPQELAQLEIQIHREQLKKSCAPAQNLIQAERMPSLKNAWAKVPAALQKNPEIIFVFAQQLALNFEDQEAELLIRKAVLKEWHQGMVYLYGRLRGRDSRQQMRTAEEWLVNHPQDPILLLTLGRLSMRNELWGKARDYFKESLRIKRDPEVYAELARLLDNMGEHQKGTDYYQLGLGLTMPPLPDLPQPKKFQ